MIIKKILISKINAAKYNPRLDLMPGDEDYEKLKKSIEEFDLVEPLVFNEHNDVLVGGHQRLKILKARGDKTVFVSVVDIKNEKKERRLNLVLNKVQGKWDMIKLEEVFKDLDSGEFTGFDMQEIKDIMGEVEPPKNFESFDEKLGEVECPKCGHRFTPEK